MAPELRVDMVVGFSLHIGSLRFNVDMSRKCFLIGVASVARTVE